MKMPADWMSEEIYFSDQRLRSDREGNERARREWMRMSERHLSSGHR
jgi:hypothetical protein